MPEGKTQEDDLDSDLVDTGIDIVPWATLDKKQRDDLRLGCAMKDAEAESLVACCFHQKFSDNHIMLVQATVRLGISV